MSDQSKGTPETAGKKPAGRGLPETSRATDNSIRVVKPQPADEKKPAAATSNGANTPGGKGDKKADKAATAATVEANVAPPARAAGPAPAAASAEPMQGTTPTGNPTPEVMAQVEALRNQGEASERKRLAAAQSGRPSRMRPPQAGSARVSTTIDDSVPPFPPRVSRKRPVLTGITLGVVTALLGAMVGYNLAPTVPPARDIPTTELGTLHTVSTSLLEEIAQAHPGSSGTAEAWVWKDNAWPIDINKIGLDCHAAPVPSKVEKGRKLFDIRKCLVWKPVNKK